MIDKSTESTRPLPVRTPLWDLLGALFGAVAGAAAGAGGGVGFMIAMDWRLTFLGLAIGATIGAVAGGLVGYCVGGAAGLAFDVLQRIRGRRSRLPLHFALASGALMAIRVMIDKEGTWTISIASFLIFATAGCVAGGSIERAAELLRRRRSREPAIDNILTQDGKSGNSIQR